MKLTARPNRATPSSDSLKQKSGGESWYKSNYGDGQDPSQNRRGVKRGKYSGSAYRRFQLQWRLFTLTFRGRFLILALWILSMLVLRIWDQCFYQTGGFGGQPSSPSTFAVVINTFRRPERLQQTVRHYADTCGRNYAVGQVFVVWADQETDPPASGDSFFESPPLRGTGTNETNRVTVEILKKSKDSLNARFEPIPNLETTSVFMVDDDIRVDCVSLKTAFSAWQNHPNSMVGYYPRLAAPPRSQAKDPNQLVYHAWPMVYWRQKLNIILTKASFLHSKYLELYTNDDSFPREIKDHVDKHRNCEDIAMSMLVANYTKYTEKIPACPLYVEGSVSDVGLFGGISSGSGHFATRSDCLTQLTAIFRSEGWDPPLETQFSLGASSWVQHSPGFWWQSSPSNGFEWLGLVNVFS